MTTRAWIARNLAAALLAGTWNHRARAYAAKKLLGGTNSRKRAVLLRKLTNQLGTGVPPSPDWLRTFLLSCPEFDPAVAHIIKQPQRLHAVLKSPKFSPSEKFSDLDLPKLEAAGELAEWLGVSIEHLEWFADSRRQQEQTEIPILQHYDYTFHPKKHGSPRLVESPKPRLKTIQRRILREILDLVPVHPCSHGFVRGRSAASGAQCHSGEFCIVTADIKDYFTTTPIARIHGMFRSIGYPWIVARLFTGICTTRTPPSVFEKRLDRGLYDWQTKKQFQQPHLPQGAPTSPALANLTTYSMDCRLEGLANRFDARYTRYADDLAFSGDQDFCRRIPTFMTWVDKIVRDEGFKLHAQKTRIMPRSQSQRITGIVVNERINAPRESFDELKAILHNCAAFGPQNQNRSGVGNFEKHLRGRISWMESLSRPRGRKLWTLFEKIRWT